MNLDKRFLIWGLGYAAVGLALGIYMAATHNHGEPVTHTHILLIGFVLSLVYGIIHKLWLQNPNRTLANIQFVVHQAAAVTISVGLFLVYGNIVPESTLGPILGMASAVLLAVLLMLYMVTGSGRGTAAVESS